MSDADVIERLLAGASLRTWMVPDARFSGNEPERWESAALPHVLVADGAFWAKSESNHLLHGHGAQGIGRCAWCYTSIDDFFCAYAPESGQINVMAKSRCKRHEWRLRDDHRLVWDSAGDADTGAVRDAIEAGSRFKVAMLDSEDVWNIHPIDLPCYFPGSGAFQLKTGLDDYPAEFRSRAASERMFALIRDKIGLDAGNKYNIKIHKFTAFYSLFADGTYYNFFDIGRGSTQTYQRLKVFADGA